MKILISGGGTGGHIFPALSIANALKRRDPSAEILFVGAENRMEMERVPDAGYKIIGLPVAGFNRKNIFKNFAVLLKLRKSMSKARKIVKQFQPDIAIGVGGYASGPTLKSAQKLGVPTLLQEQNSYAGVTNKLLAKHADRICVAYDGMERFFPSENIIKTGNPIRKDLTRHINPRTARESFGLKGDAPTLLIVGGSLGARTLNEAMERNLARLAQEGIQVIWQTGKNQAERWPKAAKGLKGIVVTKFVTDMASAYAAANLVVSRAGASSISELQVLGKPCILVPSPNVAEDHQTKNARALSDRGAAILVTDADAVEKLVDTALQTMKDEQKLASMAKQIKEMALPNADELIADEAISLINSKK